MSSLIRWSLLAISFASSVYTTPLSTTPYNAPRQRSPLSMAPLMVSEHPHGSIENAYIVVLKQDLSPLLLQNHFNFLQMAHTSDPLLDDVSGIQQVYSGHINGYAGKFTDSVVEQLRYMPEVEYIERDQIVRTMNLTTQRGAPWGLARISHRPKLTFATFTKYVHDSEGGAGVDVYVVDTGINVNHVEFEGRASWGKTVPLNDVDEDGNGHGSHCAGTIASRKYGVAKKANVIAVKVLGSNGSGSMSDVVSGVLWAAQQATAKMTAARAEYAATGKTSHKGSVANMSLGGGKSKALDDAVNRAVDAGLHFAVAAGNDNRDACQFSPAGAEKAVTVGASTLGDERAYFSNHGKCVDVFGPGLNILSTWNTGPTSTNTISGTSMASPHVAGLLAYFLSQYKGSDSSSILPVLQAQHVFAARSISSIYNLAHSVLPIWVSEFLPSPRLVAAITAPTPKEPSLPSTAELKKSLLDLATPDLLADLPSLTPNLLIFNDATS